MDHDIHTEQSAATQLRSSADPALSATLRANDGPAKQQGLAPGQFVGRYQIDEQVGAGAMGLVYRAHDPELDRKIALKVLKAGEGDYEARARLLREAQAMAKLSHPNVVAVHDVGTFGDEVFVAMEFVRGGTLREWLQEHPREWREVLEVFDAVGHGLAAAHGAGLIHRDLKPENIMIGTDRRVRVMDFGLARANITTSIATQEPDSTPQGQMLILDLTRTGSLAGTPPYMAAEQWEGATTDARSDQFAFCVAFWESLYGERPFRGATIAALMLAITRGTPMAPSDPRRAPSWLRRLLERGFSVDPAARWPSMAALLAALAAGDDRHAEPASMLMVSKKLAAVAAVLLIGAPFFPMLAGPGESLGVLAGDRKFPSALLASVPAIVGCIAILRAHRTQQLLGVLALLGGLGMLAGSWSNYSPIVLHWLGLGELDPFVSWQYLGFGLHLNTTASLFTMAAGLVHLFDVRALGERVGTIWAACPPPRIILTVGLCAVLAIILAWALAPPAALEVEDSDDMPARTTPFPISTPAR